MKRHALTAGRAALAAGILIAWLVFGSFPPGCCGVRPAFAVEAAPDLPASSPEPVSTTEKSAAPAADPDPYRTPLAGEGRHLKFFGYPVQIPALDRGHLTSLTLGGAVLRPKQGETLGTPAAALYLRRVSQQWRTRDSISVFVNELELDRRFGNAELVAQLENYTLPVWQNELYKNREVKATAAYWGSALASLGPGLRIPVAPWQVDNSLRLQLVGRAGYFYAGRADETGSTLVLPPDTLLYGSRLRVRYDSLRRNVLELPHRGLAAGFDVDYLVRERWHGEGTAGAPRPAGNRDYLHATGYLVAASPLPGFPERERDRMLLSVYAGGTPRDRGDRFNAFRINGGPFPSEEDDLARARYLGIFYDDILVTNYATVSAAYRREMTFFLYLTLAGSYFWAERGFPEADGRVTFRDRSAVGGTASLDCAFFWNSSLNFAYSWDSGAIRNGTPGSGFLLLWNKLL